MESHSIPGGAAHSFERNGHIFDSGPSLFSGFSSEYSPNPLKHVFDLIDENVEWMQYKTWGVHIPEIGAYKVKELYDTGAGPQLA